MGGTVFIFFYVMIDALKFWNGSLFRYPGEYVEPFLTPSFLSLMLMRKVNSEKQEGLGVVYLGGKMTKYIMQAPQYIADYWNVIWM